MSQVPIFPLPETVFFPSAKLPLHLFEPRYLQMAEDVLAGDRRLVIVLLRPGWQSDYYGNPPVHEIATLGRIEAYERLEGGRFDILLHGIERVRLLPPEGEEPLPGKLYRARPMRAAPELLPNPGPATRAMVERLCLLWRELAEKSGTTLEGRTPSRDQSAPFVELVNQIASWADIAPGTKQTLLEEDDLLQRAALLDGYLTEALSFWRTLARFRRFVPEDPHVN